MKKLLLDVCDFQGGTQPPKEEWIAEPRDGYIRMLQIRDYTQGDEKFVEYVLDNGKLHKCTKDDIMLSRYGYIGQAFMGLEGAYNVALVKVIKKEEILSKYLLYYFKSKYFQNHLLENVGARATIPGFNKTELQNAVIEIPTIEYQKNVANILTKNESIIDTHHQQLSALDDLIKARFVEMFGDPVSNPLRLPVKKLSDLGSLDRGRSQHRPRNAPELLGGPYPLIQTGEVAAANLYINEYHSTYSELGLKQSKMWKAGTLCITIAANIAQTAILTFDACFPDSVVGFIPGIDTSALYMHYWFCFFQKILDEQAPQVAQKNINLKILSDLNVITPTHEQIEAFELFVAQVDKSKVVIQKALDEAQILFDSLMQKYFW